MLEAQDPLMLSYRIGWYRVYPITYTMNLYTGHDQHEKHELTADETKQVSLYSAPDLAVATDR